MLCTVYTITASGHLNFDNHVNFMFFYLLFCQYQSYRGLKLLHVLTNMSIMCIFTERYIYLIPVHIPLIFLLILY